MSSFLKTKTMQTIRSGKLPFVFLPLMMFLSQESDFLNVKIIIKFIQKCNFQNMQSILEEKRNKM